jgi:hypothetical protein
MLEAALDYARLGYTVVPINAGSKLPAVRWRDLQTNPWDADQIKAHWEKHPTHGIGVIPASRNTVVIDADVYKADTVQQDFAQICIDHQIDLSEAVTVKTPSGGLHVWLQIGEAVRSGSDVLADGIDIRCEGGYAIVPPSLNEVGKAYEWGEAGSVFDNPILEPCHPNLIEKMKVKRESETAEVFDLDSFLDQPTADGREKIMRDAVFSVGMEFARRYKAVPPDDLWMQMAWALYRPQVSERDGRTLEMDDRGETMMRAKIRSSRIEVQERLNKGLLDDPDFERIDLPEVDQEPPLIASHYKITGGADIPPREWIYGKHYIRKFLSATVAPGGVGKSQQAITEALSMACGFDLLRDRAMLNDRYRVWYFNLEDPIEELARRVEATAKYFNLTNENIQDRLLIDSGRDQKLLIAKEVKGEIVAMTPVIESIIKEIQDKKIDVLIVDPFIHSHAVSENSNEAIGEVVDHWKYIANMANCSIEMIHHTRKLNAQTEASAEDSRGASALVNAARSVRAISRVPKEQLERAGIEDDPRRFFYSGIGDKANLAPPPDSNQWRKLVSVDLGNATPEYPEGDNIGVVTNFEPPSAFDMITVQHLVDVQTLMAKNDERVKKSDQSGEWIGYLIGEVCEIPSDTKPKKIRIKQIIKAWVESKSIVETQVTNKYRKPVLGYEVGNFAK